MLQKGSDLVNLSLSRGISASLLAVLAVSTLEAQAPAADKETKAMSKEKQQVKELLKSIETREPGPAAVIHSRKYIQHNLAVGDGLEGFGAVLKLLPPRSAKVNTVRVLQDGRLIFAHTDYDFFGPKIGFDIFRFED